MVFGLIYGGRSLKVGMVLRVGECILLFVEGLFSFLLTNQTKIPNIVSDFQESGSNSLSLPL